MPGRFRWFAAVGQRSNSTLCSRLRVSGIVGFGVFVRKSQRFGGFEVGHSKAEVLDNLCDLRYGTAKCPIRRTYLQSGNTVVCAS